MVTEIPEEEEEAARHLMNENMPARHHTGMFNFETFRSFIIFVLSLLSLLINMYF